MAPLLRTTVAGSSHMPEKMPPRVSTLGPNWSEESAGRRPTPTSPRFTRGAARTTGCNASASAPANEKRYFFIGSDVYFGLLCTALNGCGFRVMTYGTGRVLNTGLLRSNDDALKSS